MDWTLWLLLGAALAVILVPLIFFDVRERLHHRESRKRGRRRSDKIRLEAEADDRLREMRDREGAE
ncbi:MAG TPA: hypothetical protein VK391_09300 [Allosphingosinicella sp.]|nr:hypothetical protein [Allosphingosinicella sp.]